MANIQRYLKKTNSFQSEKSLPLLNSLFVERFTTFNPYSHDNNFKTYMKWARRSPQLMGFLNIIATDMLSDQIEFVPIKDVESGRNKILKAKAFWNANNGIEVVEETIYDMLITGIGYNWLGLIEDDELKEFCSTAMREVYPELKAKDLEFKAESMVSMIKKDNKDALAKKLRHVASSTMTIHTDEYEVLKYIQRVGVHTKMFSPKEIIPFKLFPLDGKVWPFPPMEAILAEVYLMWLINQNYISFFENGGKPDNIFILPKEIAGSKNHKFLIDTLRKYKKIQNRHGNLVFTGDLSVEKMMEVEQQMENKDLGLYLVGLLAMMYGIPVSRIPFLVGKAASGGDAGGLADSGYWRKISVWQSKIEAAYNSQLWNPYFGVDMKFKRGYLQDEVREIQNEISKNNVVEQRLNLGLWDLMSAGRYLNIDEDIILKAQEEKKKRDEEAMKSGMLLQNDQSKRNVIPDPDNRKKRKDKQTSANKNQADAGGKKINP